MIKSKILLKLEQLLLGNIEKAGEAFRSSYEYTTKGDIKSDGKYDTRATEAGYLASAQKRRLEELKTDLNQLRALPIRDLSSNQSVAVGALMELECEKKTSHYFISPSFGGETLEVEGISIHIISQKSPLSIAAFGLEQDDSFELETPRGLKVYYILGVQ